jgi:membrane carboxypeptidase/penicillin-binding protein
LLTKSLAGSPNHPANLGVVAVAGKTGTAKKSVEGGRGYSSDLYTSFIGYLPAEKPKLLAMVVIDSPKISEAWGSTVAAPIFRNIALEAIHYYGLAPRKTISVETPRVVVLRKHRSNKLTPHFNKPTQSSSSSSSESKKQSAITPPSALPSEATVPQETTVPTSVSPATTVAPVPPSAVPQETNPAEGGRLPVPASGASSSSTNR